MAVSLDSRYIWDGDITQQKLDSFKHKLYRLESITRAIEFRNSPGAPANAVRISNEMNDLIEKGKFEIFARGQCASACASAFLAAEKRTMLESIDGKFTYLLIHPFRSNKTNEINYGATDLDLKKFIEKSKGKITMNSLEIIYEAKNTQGGMYIFREPVLTIFGYSSVIFCVGDEYLIPRTCKPIKNMGLKDFDILTTEKN